jgi:hypothetical protein
VKLQILEAASDDLVAGFRFYERNEQDIGDYFLTCLYSDIGRFKLLANI